MVNIKYYPSYFFVKCFLLFFAIFLFDSDRVRAESGAISDIELLTEEANNGNLNATFLLGLSYSIGYQGVEQDEDKANRLITNAVERKYPLALLYYGKSLVNSYEGLKYITEAAELGYNDAAYYLGEIYRTPENGYTEINYNNAIKWLTIAAENEETPDSEDGTKLASLEAKFRLYMMYESGDGVERDPKEAARWINLASGQAALHSRNTLYKFDGNLKEDFDFFKNEKFISIRLAAENGNPEAQGSMSYMMNSGREARNSPHIGRIVFKQDVDSLVKWAKLAGRNGNAKAYYYLGHYYDYGVFFANNKNNSGGGLYALPPNKKEAMRLYALSASMGYQKAIDRLALRNTSTQKPWDSNYNKAITFRYDYELNISHFIAKVSYSKSNKKALYFEIKDNHDICQLEGDSDSSSVWKFNGQAVSMFLFCDKSGSDYNYVYATAATEKGRSYIINLFKKSLSNVDVEGVGYKFSLSPSGFTNVWNSNTSVL